MATWNEMPLTGPRSATMDNIKDVVKWIGDGWPDKDSANTALWAASPAIRNLVPRTEVEVNQIGPLQWTGDVTYSAKLNGNGQIDPNKVYLEFDTTGGTQHIQQSYGTVGSYKDPALPGAAPSFGGAIGVGEDGRIHGCDIPMPVYKFTLRKIFNPAQVTVSFCHNIEYLTCQVNDAPFWGCLAGECMFLGAQGAQAKAQFPLTFHFIAQPNMQNMTVGPINGINKKGFEYLWVYYKAREIARTPKMIVNKPTYAYVEKVAFPGDFSLLRVGNGP